MHCHAYRRAARFRSNWVLILLRGGVPSQPRIPTLGVISIDLCSAISSILWHSVSVFSIMPKETSIPSGAFTKIHCGPIIQTL